MHFFIPTFYLYLLLSSEYNILLLKRVVEKKVILNKSIFFQQYILKVYKI